MKDYDIKAIEKKWQGVWYNNNEFAASNDTNDTRPTFYGLIEFPYPSGAGLHIGHIRAFSGLEIVCRKRRLQGYNVLFPIGWDAFGLPTENYALKTHTHPRIVTDNNIASFVRQIKNIGFGFDFNRVIDTTDSNYYKWTQWIFKQFFDKGLAYKSNTQINYCNTCQVVLANEDSQGGVCDRCGTQVVQKEKPVWFLKIKDYSQKLLDGLDTVDYTERAKTEQRNWIGKSYGLQLSFNIIANDKKTRDNLSVFTTRADTVFGVSFVCVAPEHPLISKLSKKIKNLQAVNEYIESAKNKTEFDRVNSIAKDKTGVQLQGVMAYNTISKCAVPIFVADYVLTSYGTGAVMGVPAHDSRDWSFAKKYRLPIKQVVKESIVKNSKDNQVVDINVDNQAYEDVDSGVMINSEFLNGLTVEEAKKAVTEYATKHKVGIAKTEYKMKDWAFNRQRYWGEPIPIIHCEKCGYLSLPDSELPLCLPYMEDIRQARDGQSPLAKLDGWVKTTCHKCGGNATRETDTMPQWAGSSWYYLRYMSPLCNDRLVDKKAYDRWGQVDWYNGGMEHITRHLIYSRFWNLFLYDCGIVSHKEPYKKRTAQGLILGADGEKMSKSRGNTVNPDDIVMQYGADVLRLFVLFIGDYEKNAPWNNSSISGCARFLNRVWVLQDKIDDKADISRIPINDYINKVGLDIEQNKHNTAIATLMTLLNDMSDKGVTRELYQDFLIMLYPYAPHITEELWQSIGNSDRIINHNWVEPHYKDIVKSINLPIQINGKLKGTLSIAQGSTQEKVKLCLLDNVQFGALLKDKKIVKEIFIQDRIYNIIIALD